MTNEELTECSNMLLHALCENNKLKDLKTNKTKEVHCVICCDEVATHAMVPCGHLALCSGCTAGMKAANKSTRCPMCKSDIQSIIRIWKP
jgi:hypothetical protein